MIIIVIIIIIEKSEPSYAAYNTAHTYCDEGERTNVDSDQEVLLQRKENIIVHLNGQSEGRKKVLLEFDTEIWRRKMIMD